MKNINLIKVKSICFCAGCYYRYKNCYDLQEVECKEGEIYVNTFDSDLSLVKNYFKIKNKKPNILIEQFKKLLGVNR